MPTETVPAPEKDAPRTGWRRVITAFMRRNVTPRLGATLALWRIEARLATPLALVLVATLGRWNGALAMGGIMAVYAAVFLFLLDGEKVMDEMRGWMGERDWVRRWALPVAERRDRVGTVQRSLAIPATIMLLGPFWRALTYHLFRLPRIPAYALSVGGSFPHSLLWTGVFVGGLWEIALRPLLQHAGLW